MRVRARWWAVGLGLSFAAVYAASACRTVILDNLDAAEFQTVGAVGGLLHQPYPLWCIVARAFSALPIFEPAFRVTLVSVVFGALCVALLFTLLLRRTDSSGASAAGAAAFGLSFTFWQYSAVAEVYALVTFLFITVLYLIDRLNREPSDGAALLLALAVGMLLSQQTLNVAALPGLIALLFLSPTARGRLFARKGLALRIVALMLPLSLYVYTFLVDRGNYPMNWLDQYGSFVARKQGIGPAHMDGFFERMRFQMWIGRLKPEMPTPGEYAGAAYYWVRYFFSVEFPFVAPLFALAGWFAALRRDRRFTLFLSVLAAPYLALALTNWGEKYAYSFPVYVVAMVFVAEGVSALFRKAGRAGSRAAVATAVVVAAMPALRYATASPLSTWQRSGEARAVIESSPHAFFHLSARNDKGRTYGDAVERLVEPHSIVFGGWREANVLFYHKYVLDHLPQTEVFYTLPDWDDMEVIIDRFRPSAIYLTAPPEKYGLDYFAVVESHRIFPDQTLYRVRRIRLGGA